MEILDTVSLKPYNTFGIEQYARHFTKAASVEELKEALLWAKKKEQPTLIIGGGSNILLTGDYNGLVIKNELQGYQVVSDDDDFVTIKVAAGEIWHQFVLHCLKHQYAGVENLALIPGCVGASPMQNIGAYGVEIKEVFCELTAVHRLDHTTKVFSKEECSFGYRESVFKNSYKDQFVITDVTYRLQKKPVFHIEYGAIRQELDRLNVTELSINAIAQAVINIRSSKLPDPAEIGNAGSFFKNPSVEQSQYLSLKKAWPDMMAYENADGTMKLAAGWLIEHAGLKGYRKGDAGIHEKQALVLVNYGNASGRELLEVCNLVTDTVFRKYGVQLHPEVNVI
ncbi:UDP-N-acetylenolpyruvoylglucosamine reductase [Niabella ginsenosidivorans]|uniref:UDP-N-acetylenolpyruvoylglucosamine reductase n=1 Tax=Niabella ginsenosidivorans TaxID=1176587 RepID=A0A1A9I8F4_9BACT|nr:UDP-N-acetylmuramate dehydrogenase [Niabella ginsenosidivorans]ANH83958.1 UDP-N-acetylenolpyruvoylglucosamine reductase [Niabella ginsenosidivorans]